MMARSSFAVRIFGLSIPSIRVLESTPGSNRRALGRSVSSTILRLASPAIAAAGRAPRPLAVVGSRALWCGIRIQRLLHWTQMIGDVLQIHADPGPRRKSPAHRIDEDI